MTDTLVVNASPLILLGRIGQIELLSRFGSQVLIPDRVIEEVAAGTAVDPSAAASVAWAMPFSVPPIPVPGSIASWELGAGESQVLSVAAGATAAEVVLDDLAARRCALALGLKVVGTLGIVLRAKRLGLIPSAQPLIASLRANGMFLHQELVAHALKIAGE